MKSRSSGWAQAAAVALRRTGISPNAISAASVVMAAFGGLAFVAAGAEWIPWWVGWIVGAVMVQLRLVCNLLDGMVAVEGGRKTATGDLWNEIPDRFADAVLLAGAGVGAGCPWWGAGAAWAAVMTAYVRAFGASLTGKQDFRGPLAKPQRMAVLTVAALATAAEKLWQAEPVVMDWALAVIAVGSVVTFFRRQQALARQLKAGGP